ncbi:hypothetical protein I2400191J7_18330 [Ruminococcus bicirculans (ex Wegman et al. 2014)]
MKGYKVFKPDWTCRGFQYSVGKTFEEDMTPSCCNRGFHFCTELKDCFSYYCFDPLNKVAEIEALGEIDTEATGKKHCTNKIKIVREISWEEVLKMINVGKANTGFGNTGNYNSGNYNSGHWNSGTCNTGIYNTGIYNTGNYNTGDCNSGNFNDGSYNSGDFNKTNFSNGCFNTKKSKILMFNKSSDWSIEDWRCSKAKRLLDTISYNALQWVYSDKMTEEEKEQHPKYKTVGGYLKELDKSECGQLWWDNLSDCDKNVIKSLPNFDAEIFKEITGIDINKGV